jgi:uncharacterized protein (DUF1015 family)
LINTGRYVRQPPALFLYRLVTGSHQQTAVIADLSVRDARDGRVRAHEQTRATKEAELARHLAHLHIHSSPVGLGYRAIRSVDELVERLATARPADLDFVSTDGLRQQVWTVQDPDDVAALRRGFAGIERTYIIDGHHRVAAANQIDGEGHFLAALIPDHELRLLPYHRVVAGERPADLAERITRLAGSYAASPTEQLETPRHGQDFLLYCEGRWIALHRRRALGGRLAAAVADAELLGPLFAVHDTKNDPRLSFVAGRPPPAVAAVADVLHGSAVVLSAATLGEVFREADAGRPLPPKSTWFEPKLRSGVFIVWR